MSDADDTDSEPDRERSDRYDAVVVGCGPAGAAAGVFLARDGLDTAVFDRGAASLDRCAFLGNYPGFPVGIDIETFQELLREHAREAGCTYVADLVEAVRRTDDLDPDGDSESSPDLPTDSDDARFVVETQDGRCALADRVVAAARYDGEYLRPLGGDAMFVTHEHGGEEHEHFDRDYPDEDGRTEIEGLYVASPSGQRDVQAVVAAGQGAHVARTLIEDRRLVRGYPRELARHYDWLRPDSEFDGERGDREHWAASFDERVPDDHDVSEDRLAELREEYVDRAFETHRSADEVADLTERAHRRLLDHLDDDLVLERAAEIEADTAESDR